MKGLLDVGVPVVALGRGGASRSLVHAEGLESRVTPAVTLLTGDVADPGLGLDRALREHDVSVVFHLAAQSILEQARRAPLETWEVNVRGTWLVLEACREAGVECCLMASSDKVNGPVDRMPAVETDPLRAVAPYGASKAAADLIARSYWAASALPVAVVRASNLYGGGDPHVSRLVPETMSALLSGRLPAMRSDGSPRRDFLHVQDAVAAWLALTELVLGGAGRGEAYNVGSGRPVAVAEVVATAHRAAGMAPVPGVGGLDATARTCDASWLDASKLRGATGWAPRVDLEEGLRRTLRWYRAHPAVLGLAPPDVQVGSGAQASATTT